MLLYVSLFILFVACALMLINSAGIWYDTRRWTETSLRSTAAYIVWRATSTGCLPSSGGAAGHVPYPGESGPSVDEWGSAITYVVLATGFELRSHGPDGKPGTSDDIVHFEAIPKPAVCVDQK